MWEFKGGSGEVDTIKHFQVFHKNKIKTYFLLSKKKKKKIKLASVSKKTKQTKKITTVSSPSEPAVPRCLLSNQEHK